MRGPSRASLTEAKERLAALGGRVTASLGDELFGVTDLLQAQSALRRVLADPARAPRARAELASALLAGKISEDAVTLVAEAAASRWSLPGDLVDAIEQIAVLAVVADAERAGTLDDVEDDLFRFGRVVSTEPRLRIALSNPFAPAELKDRLVHSLLDGKVGSQTLTLVTQAALHPRGRSLDSGLAEYARLAAEQRQRLVAVARVATDLSPAQRDRLAVALSRAYGRDVHLNIVLDPEVIGGMSIRVGDEQIDGSVASRLAGLRRGGLAA
ncbi:MAG TPA: F0F1 ATP synthase subunit delta [Candidatus Limnocylindria bacterium]|nr:F0F1 ATP synthase subunit delta [Candidatus Limnocylindria bacterium]